MNPHTQFALWTKRPELVTLGIVPPNLILVYFQLMLNAPGVIPKGFHKCFSVHTDDVELSCGEKCFECLKCYKTNDEIYIRERLR